MEEFLLVYVQNLMCCILFFVNFPRRPHFVLRFSAAVCLGAAGGCLVGPLLAASDQLGADVGLGQCVTGYPAPDLPRAAADQPAL